MLRSLFTIKKMFMSNYIDKISQFPKKPPEPVQYEDLVNANVMCFNTMKSNRFTANGCYCWKGREDCVDIGQSGDLRGKSKESKNLEVFFL